ncbi:MAG: oxidoreductase, partial [Actinomycetota bacterium]|nr:oxidoreductase [Actinomycetota bacterium]
LTAWLGPQIDVPHLGIAWGTLPDLWFYIDFNARSDLMLDTDSLDKYFEPMNDDFLELRADEGLAPFTSKALYVRQALSETAICFTTPGRTYSEERLNQISQLAHTRVDQWLAFVDEAEPVPAERRVQLAADDLTRRRNIAERDPANVMAVRFFGDNLTSRLVAALWGGDRQLPRPT